MDLLARIQQLATEGRLIFTKKAADEMEMDQLTRDDVRDSILNAVAIRSKRSTSPFREVHRERIRIIEGMARDGFVVYTKGMIRRMGDMEFFYIFVSAKRSRRDGAR